MLSVIKSIATKITAFFTSIIMMLSGGSIKPDPKPVEPVYTVSFVNYDGKTVINTQNVKEGESAVPPANPAKSGTSFLGWSGNYVNVVKNETVKAVFSDEKNVFVVTSAAGKKGDTVKLTVSLKGNVKTCGFDMNIVYDSNLKLVSYDDDLDLDIIVNSKTASSSVLLNYSGANNTTKKKDIISLTFKIKDADKSKLPVKIQMNSVKEISGNSVVNSNYVSVSGIVSVNN